MQCLIKTKRDLGPKKLYVQVVAYNAMMNCGRMTRRTGFIHSLKLAFHRL